MNLSLRTAIVCLSLTFSYSAGLLAQQSFNEMAVVAGVATAAPSGKKVNPKIDNPYKGKSPDYYRHHKRLPATYSGYVIELAVSEKPLRRDDELFEQFGKVYYQQLENDEYAYCILLDFKTRKAMKKYLTEVVQHRVPDAQLVMYAKGSRKIK